MKKYIFIAFLLITGFGQCPDYSKADSICVDCLPSSINGSSFTIVGPEGGDASLILDADEGDDDADTWTIQSTTATNLLTFLNHTSTILTLSPAGNLTASGSIYAADGSAASPGFAFNSGANTGLYYHTPSSTLRFTTAGTDKLTLGLTGNLTLAAGQILMPAGSVSAPSLSFTGNTGSGIYQDAANRVAIGAGGTLVMIVGDGFPQDSGNVVRMRFDNRFCFAVGDATNSACDTIFERAAAGKLKITDTLQLVGRATAPASPTAGDIYMDSAPTPDKLRFYDGAAWQNVQAGTRDTVQTTNATVTTIKTIATATDRIYGLKITITGLSSTAAEGAHYVFHVTYRNDGGIVTQIGAAAYAYIVEDTVAWDADAAISGTNILIRVTGAAATTINWTAVVEELN